MRLYFLAISMLALTAASNPVAEDRRDFEEFWMKEEAVAAKAGMPKEAAWHLWEWAQLQFSLGYCSEFITAGEAEHLRELPNEKSLMENPMGRMMIGLGRNSFREGMKFQRETRPTKELCQREMDGRAETLKAITEGRTR